MMRGLAEIEQSTGYASTDFAEAARSKRARKSACERQRMHEIRVYEPARHRQSLDRANSRYHEKKTDPQWIANRRAAGRRYMRQRRLTEKLVSKRLITPERYQEALGKAIRAERRRLGLSIYALAKRLRTQATSVADLERNQRGGSTMHTVYRYAVALGVQPSKLLKLAERIAVEGIAP